MKKKDILKDAKEILEMLPNASENDVYSFIFEINNTIKRLTDNLSIRPYISLVIKNKSGIIEYLSANSAEKTYNNQVDEIKKAIITYKKLNDLKDDRNN